LDLERAIARNGSPKDLTLGIVGGMGHVSTIQYYSAVVAHYQRKRNAIRNADFPRVCISGIAGADHVETMDDEYLYPDLLESITRLREDGADLIGMPCNTATTLLRRLSPEYAKGIIDIVERTAREISTVLAEEILLLGTRRLLASNIYQNHQLAVEQAFVLPSYDSQRALDTVILGVNSGRSVAELLPLLLAIAGRVEQRRVLVLACTELSVFSSELRRQGHRVIDSLHCLTRATIEMLELLESRQ
jgi:aspartate racemase